MERINIGFFPTVESAMNRKVKDLGINKSEYIQAVVAQAYFTPENKKAFFEEHKLKEEWLTPIKPDLTCDEQTSHYIYEGFEWTRPKQMTVRLPEILADYLKGVSKEMNISTSMWAQYLIFKDLSASVMHQWWLFKMCPDAYDDYWKKTFGVERPRNILQHSS